MEFEFEGGKVQPILMYVLPQTMKQLRAFLGEMSFYWIWIPFYQLSGRLRNTPSLTPHPLPRPLLHGHFLVMIFLVEAVLQNPVYVLISKVKFPEMGGEECDITGLGAVGICTSVPRDEHRRTQLSTSHSLRLPLDVKQNRVTLDLNKEESFPGIFSYLGSSYQKNIPLNPSLTDNLHQKSKLSYFCLCHHQYDKGSWPGMADRLCSPLPVRDT